MKILVTSPIEVMSPVVRGGVQMFVMKLLRAFPEFHFLAKDGDDLSSYENTLCYSKANLKTAGLGGRLCTDDYEQYAKDVLKHRETYDLVLVNTLKSSIIRHFIADGDCRGLVLTNHTLPVASWIGIRYTALMKKFVQFGGKLLVNSEYTKRECERWDYNTAPERIRSFIDCAFADQEAIIETDFRDKMRVFSPYYFDEPTVYESTERSIDIAYLGRIDPDRSSGRFLAMLKKAQLKSVAFVAFTEKDRTLDMLSRFRIECDSCHVDSSRETICKALNNTRIFVSTFDRETFGIAAVEAAAYGCNVIHTTNKESVLDETLAGICPVHRAYDKSLLDISDSDGVAKRAREKFSKQSFVASWTTLLEEIQNEGT